MGTVREEPRVGREYLAAVTELLQRVRGAHPTKGLFEAADLQWWWARPRPTDSVEQLFWFDDQGRPEAAVIITDWAERVAFDPFLMPDATPDFVAHVIGRGLAHSAASGFHAVELEVSQADDVLRQVLFDHGFVVTDVGFVTEAWLAADARPAISSLHDNYRLTTRSDTLDRPHHNHRSGPELSERLLQTSLYSTDRDLLIVDHDENQAAYGMFWYDPETATGLVEPMRTEEDHQKRGLARHILTSGIDRLAKAGAERIKIVFESDNPGASHLYLSVGFEPDRQTDVFARTTKETA